jgi:tellurite resistance protein
MLDQTQLEHFRNLVSLVSADGEISESERTALSRIAYDRGIPLERFNVMLSKAHEYHYLIPQNQVDREKQLNDMIEVAHLDGNFSKAEHDMILTVGGKLGFEPHEIESIIENHGK